MLLSLSLQEYRVVFNELTDVSLAGLAPFAVFNFKNQDGSVQYDSTQ